MKELNTRNRREELTDNTRCSSVQSSYFIEFYFQIINIIIYRCVSDFYRYLSVSVRFYQLIHQTTGCMIYFFLICLLFNHYSCYHAQFDLSLVPVISRFGEERGPMNSIYLLRGCCSSGLTPHFSIFSIILFHLYVFDCI